MNHDHKHDQEAHDRSTHDHKGHDHPQTIDAEPLEQTRSAELLKEQEEKTRAGAVPRPADDAEDE